KFSNNEQLAIVGGKVSGNLEVIDIDDPTIFDSFLGLLGEKSPDLPEKLCQRKTPNGYHLAFRSKEPIQGNQVLAAAADNKVRIETRGEGGYFLHHPSQGYGVINRSLTDCSVLTPDEINTIHLTAGLFDQRDNRKATGNTSSISQGSRPGDDFNEKHNSHDILEREGWAQTKPTSLGIGYTRPGKNKDVSGVLFENDNFYCWSTNAHPLEGGKSYSPFALFTMYYHQGNFSEAAKDIAKQGYGDTQVVIEESEWSEPQPLKAELPPVEPIVEQMIPEPFKGWIMDAADRMQVPPDYILAPVILTCGSIIGTSCRIRPKQKDDWSVVPNLWGGIVGPPSMLKSPALSEAVNKTLGRLEATARENHEEAEKEFNVAMMLDEANIKAIKVDIDKAVKRERGGNGKGKSTQELTEELMSLQEADPPVERRYKTNDSSIEKLVELLGQSSPRGILYFRDELIGLFKRAEKAGHEQDRAFLLESWNGDGSHTDDRIGRGTVRTDNLCVSLLGSIQPDKITGYLHRAMSEGDNDGFVQRLQLMVYPPPVKNWKYRDKHPDTEAKNRAYSVIERLAEMEVQGEDIFEKPYLRFSPDGQEVFKKWLTWLETEKLVNNDEHPVMLEHLAKYRSLMPSLALIFHLIEAAESDTQPGPVSHQAAGMAAAWCHYLESHARKIYSLATNGGVAGAIRLAEKIKEGKTGDSFKIREVQQKNWGLLKERKDILNAIDHLIDNGWLIEKPVYHSTSKACRPESASTYYVNPKIFQNA
ncbi:MAG: DUF3987 domain-containing protein, partial [Desulfobulbaceae bacterium]|nr:DUF3987 domain-containing protein [Desulfobulbaceae bacterium]